MGFRIHSFEQAVISPKFNQYPEYGMYHSSKETVWKVPTTFLIPKKSPLHASLNISKYFMVVSKSVLSARL